MSVELDNISQEELINIRFCDLGLEIKGTRIEEYVETLYSELKQKGMKFLPPCYLSDEWFSPVGIGAIAIPFYLAHPVLTSLEKKFMSEAEGGTRDEAMKLMRHECGHAYVHAFNLSVKRRWMETFGHPGKPYDEYYRYRPYSKSFVNNLNDYYSQSHPEEDFAETFAVWLDPGSNWDEYYKDWPAHRKLVYVDELMNSLKDRTVKVFRKDYYYNLKTIKKRLSPHDERKKKLYIEYGEDFFDRDLRRLFPSVDGKTKPAYDVIYRHRRKIESIVCRYVNEKKYIVSGLVGKLLKRMKVLDLRIRGGGEEYLLDFAVYVAALTGNYHYTSRYKRK